MSFQMMHFNKNVPHVHIKALWYRLDLEATLSWQRPPPWTCNQGGRSLSTCSSSYQPQLSRHFSILFSRPSFHSHVLTSIWLEMLQPGTRRTLMKTRTLSREDWVLYWHLRQGGKNILMPIFLSEVNGQQPPPPPSHPYFNHLSVWLNCVYISPTLAPQSPFHAAGGAWWLQIVTLYAPWK